MAAEPEETEPTIPPQMIEELTTILTAVNTAQNGLKKFELNHPYLVAPNILRVWEDSLKETSNLMFREFYRLRNQQ